MDGVPELAVSGLFSSVYDFLEDTLLPPLGWKVFSEVLQAYQDERDGSRYEYIDVLPILTCVAAGGDAMRARPLAAAWVCYILATRILDDVQDQEGQDQIWSKEGAEHAMSLGLFAIGVAQTAVARLQLDSETQQAIVEAFGKVQALSAAWQTRRTALEELTVDRYFQSLTARTGLIFATGAWAGARIVKPLPEERVLDALYQYGLCLGIMGQIVDDCQDLAGVDLPSGTFTLPVIYALSQREHPEHPRLVEALNGSDAAPMRVESIASSLSEMKAVEWSLQVAEVYRQRAIAALESLPADRIRPLLDYVSTNDYPVT